MNELLQKAQERFQDILSNEKYAIAQPELLHEILKEYAEAVMKRAYLFAAHRLSLPKGSTKHIELTIADLEMAWLSLEK